VPLSLTRTQRILARSQISSHDSVGGEPVSPRSPLGAAADYESGVGNVSLPGVGGVGVGVGGVGVGVGGVGVGVGGGTTTAAAARGLRGIVATG
jgi:hypothetical protein